MGQRKKHAYSLIMPDDSQSQPPLLLKPHEPPAYEVVNLQGRAPLVLVCDHASRRVPEALGDLGLPSDVFDQHVAYDIGAAELTRQISARLDAPAVLAGYSRLVIDVNRQPGDPTAIPEVSDGIAIPGNQDLSEADMEARSLSCSRPYHNAITETIAHVWRTNASRENAAPLLFSIHSFTPVFGGKADRPWQAAVLWNRDPRIAVPLIKRLEERADKVIGDNEPYSGKQLAYTIDRHGAAAGLANCAIEVRQDELSTEAGIRDWAERLSDALGWIMADARLHRVEHF
ncbi:MAG: N-formylglutamate amidohydrolase [Magnetovibrionaceae bacterium]